MTAGSVWLAIGAFITAVCGLAGVIYTALTSRRATREQAKASPYKDMGEQLARTHDRLDKQDTKLDKQDEQIGDLQDAKREDRHRIDRLEEDQDTLVGELEAQDDWQERGAEPPPPGIGQKARALLRLHGTERRADRVDRERE